MLITASLPKKIIFFETRKYKILYLVKNVKSSFLRNFFLRKVASEDVIVLIIDIMLDCRYGLFMEAFSHTSGNIDKIYKQLTKSSTHPLGGTAYLNLDNEDEPFLHGIKFTAMPPTKRFRDMEQLSGGEKTVAALALLFSIHRFVVNNA